MTEFDQELYYWTHMLDEAFADIPQQQKIDMSKQFVELLRHLNINLNKDIANIIKTWFIADSEEMNLDQLKEKYTQGFICEIRDALTNYFDLKKQSEKSEININGQLFILKGDQSVKMSKDRSRDYLMNILQSLKQLVGSQTYSYDSSFDLNDNDKRYIKLLGCTKHIACWRTTKYKTTNKFIYHIWRNPDMTWKKDLGTNSPFCTMESGHWDGYSHRNPEYEQFWFFKLPEDCQATSGDLNNPDVMDILDKMTGHGGELLVGLDDTYLDDNNINDDNTRDIDLAQKDDYFYYSNDFILDFSFHDYRGVDYSEEIKQFYGKILFPYIKFEFPKKIQCIASYKRKDDEISYEMNQICQKIKDKTIESVVIPNGVTTIGDAAFYYCSSLKSVIIPDSVTTIDNYAFKRCKELTSITIPDSVKYIGECAFDNCKSLKKVIISKSITSIKDGVFNYCSLLTSIAIPNSVTSIGEYAFYNCKSLSSITIPDSVTTIGEFAFNGCTNLTSINIPKTITSINYNIFDGCESLKSITIPDSVTSIDDYAFSGCKSLRSIIIPNSVTSFGNCVFENCESLASITMPNSITAINYGMFSNCSSLKSIEIPNSVTSIGKFAFDRCGLTSITIPDSVTSIDDFAFRYCDGLTSIIIPDSVTSIADGVFNGCSMLMSITIPSSVTSMQYAFIGCMFLKSVIVPDQKTANVVLKFNSDVKDLIKIQPVNESKYSNQQLLEAINYWTNVLSNKIS